MRAPGIVDRWRSIAPTVFLISVLGVLFVWPLRAAPALEPQPFRVEIDLGSSHEWTIRAAGPVLVGADGAFIWPFRQEGFSPATTTSVSHRKAGGETPTRHFFPEPNALRDSMPTPAELGYGPGDRVKIGLVRRIRPLPGGGFDQAFAFPGHAEDAPVMVEVTSMQPEIRLGQAGMVPRGGSAELRGDRKLFEVSQRQGAASPLHAFSTAPRLFLSSYPDYVELGRAKNAVLTVADQALADRAAKAAPAETPVPRIVEKLVADLRSDKGTPLERALRLRAMLLSRGIAAHIVFTNRRAILSLPDIPVGLFDTVLVSVPAARAIFDLGGSAEADVGLDPELAGRDALRLGPDGGELEKLPAARASANRIFVRADLQIGPDGAIEGQSLTETSGLATANFRKLLNRLKVGPADSGIAKLLQQQSLEGEARLGPSEQHGEVIGQHLSFRLLPVAGGDTVLRVPTIPGPRLFRPPFLDLLPAIQNRDVEVVPCRAVTVEHQIVLHLPDRRMLVEQPKDMTVIVPMGTYVVRYEIEPTRVIIRRKLEFEPGQPFCTRKEVLEMAPLIRATSRDIARQLHLRLPAG